MFSSFPKTAFLLASLCVPALLNAQSATPSPQKVKNRKTEPEPKVLPAALLKKLKAPAKVTLKTSTERDQGYAGMEGFEARFWVQCSPKDAMALLWDARRFKKIFPGIERLEVKRETTTELDVLFGIDVTLGWVEYTLRRKIDRKRHKIHWKEIGGDLNHVRGHWHALPTSYPDVTELVYASFVDPSTFIPSSMVRDGALKKAKNMPARVRKACIAERKNRKSVGSTQKAPN